MLLNEYGNIGLVPCHHKRGQAPLWWWGTSGSFW